MSGTILITGATSGFGQATARRFVKEGWKVIGTGRRQARALPRAVMRPAATIPVERLDRLA